MGGVGLGVQWGKLDGYTPYVSVERVSFAGPRYSEGVTSPLKLMSG